jgi:hypothetical protein
MVWFAGGCHFSSLCALPAAGFRHYHHPSGIHDKWLPVCRGHEPAALILAV